MDHEAKYIAGFLFIAGALALGAVFAYGQQKKESSCSPVIEEPFDHAMAQDKSSKAAVMKRHMDSLQKRYDLSKKTTTEVTMSKGKPLPVGPTATMKGVLIREKKDLTAFLRQP